MVKQFEAPATPGSTEDSGNTIRYEAEGVIDTGGNRPTIADLVAMLNGIEDHTMEIVGGVSLPDIHGKMTGDTNVSLELTEAGVITRADGKQFLYIGVAPAVMLVPNKGE